MESGLFPITPEVQGAGRARARRSRWPWSSPAACARTSTARSPTSTTRTWPPSAGGAQGRRSARTSRRPGRSHDASHGLERPVRPELDRAVRIADRRRRQALRRPRSAVDDATARRRRRRAVHAARPLGLRQDHAAAADRRVLPPPDEGEIRFGERRVDVLPPYERNIGMVFQNYALWPHMTVRGNVTYGLRLRKLAGRRDRAPAGSSAAAQGQPRRARGPLPGTALGRPAAAGGAGAGPRPQSRHPAARRAALQPRRQDPRAGARRDPQAPAGARHHHDLRHPRPGGGAVALRSRGRHARRQASSRWPRPRRCTSGRSTASWPTSSAPTTSSPASAASARPSGAVVETPLGLLRGRPADAVTVGGRCVLAVRPENVALGGGGENVVEGRVALASYLGNTLRYDVETAAGARAQGRRARSLAPRAAARGPGRAPVLPGLGRPHAARRVTPPARRRFRTRRRPRRPTGPARRARMPGRPRARLRRHLALPDRLPRLPAGADLLRRVHRRGAAGSRSPTSSDFARDGFYLRSLWNSLVLGPRHRGLHLHAGLRRRVPARALRLPRAGTCSATSR